MPATGRQLITRALIECGVLASGEVPSATELQDAHVIAKRMINSAGAERLLIHELLRTATTLTSGTRDYSLGPGGAINIARPDWIEMAGCILDSTATDPLEIPIEVFTDQRWASLRLKTLDASPLWGVYFDRKFDSNGRATLSTYPTINASNVQLVIYTPKAQTGFDALDTTYTFAPGYDELWHYALCDQLVGPFAVPELIEQRITRRLVTAERRVKMSNLMPAELFCDPAVTAQGGGWSESQFNTGGRG